MTVMVPCMDVARQPGSACSSPEASRKALAQCMQKELLRDASGSTPVLRQRPHVGFRRQIAVAIGRTDGFTDTQITGHNARASQSTGEKPLGGPPSEATTRHQAGNHFSVGL